jgi:hypothetical protein
MTMATSPNANPEEPATVTEETVTEEFHDAATVHTGENLTLNRCRMEGDAHNDRNYVQEHNRRPHLSPKAHAKP